MPSILIERHWLAAWRLLPVVLCALLSACAGISQRATVGGVGEVIEGEGPLSASGEATYHAFLAELALQRQLFDTAATEYQRAAELSHDEKVAGRAAAVAFQLGRDEPALHSARRWAQLNPDSIEALRYLASLNLRRGDIDLAVENVEAMLDKSGANPAAGLLQIASILMREPELDKAIEVMQRLVHSRPDFASGHYGLGLLALRADQIELAKASGKRASELAPDWNQAAMLYARALISGGDIDGGIDYAASAIAQSDDLAARLEYAILLAAVERDAESRAEIESILDLEPNNAGALRAMGLIELRGGDLDAAEGRFMALLGTGRGTHDAFFYLASIAESRDQMPRAVRFYSQVTAGDNVVIAQLRAARLIFELEGLEPAMTRLDRFGAAVPTHRADSVLGQGEILQEAGEIDRALAIYAEAVTEMPEDDRLIYAYAFLLEEVDRVAEAVAQLRTLVARKPEDPVALNALGYTLADRTDQIDKAYGMILKAYQIEPRNPAIIDSMGWVEYRRGNYERAIELLSEAADLIDDPEVAAHLGEVLWVMGSKDRARRIWGAALEAEPEAKVLLDTLGRFGVAPESLAE